MKRLWISGWAISPAWFAAQARAAWPGWEHFAVSPSNAADALARGGFDTLGGYSLGSLWLMKNRHLVSPKTRVTLLAPIFAFTAEAGLGGKIGGSVLSVQRRRFQKNVAGSVEEFFARAGLGNDGLAEALQDLTPTRAGDLLRELDWLRDWSATPPSTPTNWTGMVGADDVLLDAAALKKLWPALRIIPRAGHGAAALLQAAGKVDSATAIIRSFDDAAENYTAHAGPQTALAKATAELIAPEERQGTAVEFGAGTGLFTREMQPWQGTYLATDASARMVEVGQKFCPGARWRQLDACDTANLEPAEWIFACNVLQWLDQPEAVLRAWRKILLRKGRLVAAILLPETLGELREVLPEAHLLDWRSANEWRRLVTQAGFAVERAEIWDHLSEHASALALLRDLHAMGLAPWRAIGPGRLRAAMREYDRCHAKNGGVKATWRALLVRATATA